MSDKKLEISEEVQSLLDSDAFVGGFGEWLGSTGLLSALSQHLQPLVPKWQQFVKTIAPVVTGVISEFRKWDISSEVLAKAGWVPHYTTPFDDIAECSEEPEEVQERLLRYYESNWHDVRSEIESRMSGYNIDAEAKATFREALDAHEAGLYRCVCRVLFPEIERIFRKELFDGRIEHISYAEYIKKLVEGEKSLGDFMGGGFYELDIFGLFTKHIEHGGDSESSKLIYGLFHKVASEEDRERLTQDPIPNRHAAVHGLVVYSSQQNSLNAIFLADYIFRIICQTAPPSSPPH